MNRKMVCALSCMITYLFGQVYDVNRIENFYDTLSNETKNTAASVGVTTYGTPQSPSSPSPPGPPPPPPPSPTCGEILSAPSFISFTPTNPALTYVPILLVNNTGLADSLVYVVIYGQDPTNSDHQGFINFGGAAPTPTSTTGTFVPATGVNTPPSSSYSYTFAQLKAVTGGTVSGAALVYVPYVNSGEIFFSVNSAVPLAVGNNSIGTPEHGNTGGSAYNIIYGQMEFTFISTANQLTLDTTFVNFYGLSIYFDLYTNDPDAGLPNNQRAGTYQSRHYNLCELQNSLNTAASGTATYWDSLVQSSDSTILRILSPGYAMGNGTTTPFPTDYLNNAAYGFDWANDVWTGPNAFYKLSRNKLKITLPGVDTALYGTVDSSNNFNFSSPDGTYTITVPWNSSTTTNIYAPSNTFSGISYSSNLSALIPTFTKIFAAALFAGILPGEIRTLTNDGPPSSIIPKYYQNSSFLNTTNTGPWTDLYSPGLLGNTAVTGNLTYTYPYSDYLYSNDSQLAGVAPALRLMAGPNGTGNPYVIIYVGPYTAN